MTRLLRWLVLPPGVFLWLLALAFWLQPRRPRVSRALLGLTALGLYTLSLWPVSEGLMSSLDVVPPLTPEQARSSRAEVVVCLGAGGNELQPELGFGGVSPDGLERTYYAVVLHRLSGLPILFSGGGWEGHPMAENMRLAAMQMGVDPRYLEVEVRSNNTWENAKFSETALGSRRRILLVTDRWHMRRALFCFRHTQLEVVAAPFESEMPTPLDRGGLEFLPTRGALAGSTRALEEWLGLLFYRMRYR